MGDWLEGSVQLAMFLTFIGAVVLTAIFTVGNIAQAVERRRRVRPITRLKDLAVGLVHASLCAALISGAALIY